MEHNKFVAKRIDIQGNNILALDVIRCNRVEYKVGSFKRIDIALHDYRKNGIRAIACYLCNGNEENFREAFCSPALVKIIELANETYLIELHDTRAKKQDYILWAANDLGSTITYRKYLFWKAEPLNKHQVTWLSIYKIEDGEYE